MKALFTLAAALLINLAATSQSGPELVFIDPVLVSGTANQQGAIYRYSNVTTGVDAEVKLKKFSRTDIVMQTVDNPTLGWNKAFQPHFGIPGTVAANQHWYIDFEMTFYQAGSSIKQKMDTVDLTALDLDGDGQSVYEYITYDQPNSISYSTVSFLTNAVSGVLGQVMECGEDGISSPLLSCLICGGDGLILGNECGICDGSGKIHALCLHSYQGGTGSTVTGPVTNFVDIDTSATQVMATYQFLDKDRIKFRYGGRSGALSSSAAVRMNSTWFREFSLAPISTLPVKLETFTVMLNNTNNKADLKWTTSSEINVSYYVIEKSLDGKKFNDVGTIFAIGLESDKANYTYADNVNGQTGMIYYRLRSVDIGGKAQYSDTRVIRIGKTSENNISILAYPNPANYELRITIPNSWQNKKVTYELYKGNGVSARKSIIANASQTETINISSLAPGLYIIMVSCDGELAQQKIIKN